MVQAQLFLTLAIAYIMGLLFGRLAARLHIPRVTGYLIAGILAGPSLQHILGWPSLITWEVLESVEPVNQLALAFIVLTVGIKCRTENVLKWRKPIFQLSFFEISITFFTVFLATFLVDSLITKTFLTSGHFRLGPTAQMALFFGVIGIATAPAATLFVIREYEAEGPLTEKLMILIGFNNLTAIFAFIIFTHVFFELTHPLTLVLMLGIPVTIGIAIGLFMSFWAQNMDKERDYQLLCIGGVLAAVGLAAVFKVNMMLTVFVAGISLANASPRLEPLIKALQKIDYPIYVLFFVLSGAGMHLDTFTQVGLLGLAYIVARVAGKFAGSYWGAKVSGFHECDQKYLGFTLMAQAGIAIGLSRHLGGMWPEGGFVVETVILGSLVIFELAGPLSVRHGLVRSGEVSVISLLVKKASSTTFEEFHQVINHFRDALGLHRHKKLKSPKEILVNHIMKRNVETVLDTMRFNDFLKLVAFSRYDRFPVVNKNRAFIGVVDYTDIRDMIFDPSLADLIIVGDLIKKNPLVIHEEQTLYEIMKIFKKYPNITYLPVVDKNNSSKLVGILNQNTILSTFRSLKE